MVEDNISNIRGKNFSKCSLVGRDFSCTRCGVKKTLFLLSIILTALILSGFGIQISISSILTSLEQSLSKMVFWIIIISSFINFHYIGFVEAVTINLFTGFVLFTILLAFGRGELVILITAGIFIGLTGIFLIVVGELIIVLAIATAAVLTRKAIAMRLLTSVFISAIITALLDNLKASWWIRVEALIVVSVVCISSALITYKVLAGKKGLNFIYAISIACAAFWGQAFGMLI